MEGCAGERGAAFLLAILALLAGIGVALAVDLTAHAGASRRERASERALAQAREALIAYATDRPMSREVGPGYLPCPDLDGDGWAEATCGSQSGDTGQAQRLGLLPWKTLGLPDLRDGYGERLWYAVSSKYKGLLNCAVSRACLDMTPDTALGTISVRDASGKLLHDGTIAEAHRADAGGALAVVIAPGPVLSRLEASGSPSEQRRQCPSGECDAAGRCLTDPPQRATACNPVNYLDRAPDGPLGGEDNADFRDRNDAAGRPGNRNGFIDGPVVLPGGRVAVNDRLAVIGYRDVMPRLMRRIALEVRQCLRVHAARSGGRYPWPAAPCSQRDPDPVAAWKAASDTYFGRIAEMPFDAACNIPDTADHTWWASWRPFVFYALAPDFAPTASAFADCERPGACLALADRAGRAIAPARHFAVLVAGAPVARAEGLQARTGANLAAVGEWLEDTNARLEGPAACLAGPSCADEGTCGRLTVGPAARDFNDVVVAQP